MTSSAHNLATPRPDRAPLADRLRSLVSSQTVICLDEPMSRRTTFRIGGTADIYIEPAGEEDLAAVVRACKAEGVSWFVLGRGSNLLIRDGGYRGLVICLNQPAFTGIELAAGGLRCGAGAKLKSVAVEAKRRGLAGMEFLEGIPGSVGGALRMNAGAMSKAAFDVVESVRLLDLEGNSRDWPASQVEVSYRQSPTLKTHIAMSAVFHGEPAPRADIEDRMLRFSQTRWKSQPAAPSAGCAFKNPAAIPAGKLIDQLGLKGTRVGGASVSTTHGNFIVNDGGATARDVLELIDLIRKRAHDQRGIDLETEIEIIGE